MIKSAAALKEELDLVDFNEPANLNTKLGERRDARSGLRVVAGNTGYYKCKTTSSNINECGAFPVIHETTA